MNAIVRRSGGIELAEVAAPTGEAIIDVAYAGVCRTDLAVVDGAIAVAEGRVLGHELSGWLDGEPVTVVPFAACGECAGCRGGASIVRGAVGANGAAGAASGRAVEAGGATIGDAAMARDAASATAAAVSSGGATSAGAVGTAHGRCESPRWLGVDRDGAFAERVAVPRASVIRLPRDLPLAVGAFVEPVAAALGVLAVVERGMRVVIGGENRIAELTARVIAAAGATRVSHGPCDVAIEHDGNAAALIPHLRAGGTLVLKSRAARSIALPAGELVRRELIVRGASHGSFTAAVDWLHARRIDVADLLAPARPLAAYAEVFAAARSETAKQMFAIAEHA